MLDLTSVSGDDHPMERRDEDQASAPPSGHDMLRRPVPAALQGHVRDIVHYRETVRGRFRQVETASLVVPLIIGFGEAFPIGLGREPSSNETYGSFTSGIYAGPVVIHSTGAMECVQVNFTPLGAWRFFGLPMSDIASRMVSLDDLPDQSIRELRLRLADLPLPAMRLDLVTAFVADRLARSNAPDAAIDAAFSLMLARKGDIRISSIAERLDWSRKHLADRFHTTIGVSPKTLARIMRFNHAQAMARSGGDWADIAAACGYADQAHLAREFVELSGSTPTAWKAAA
jgi:AraC-like DNA-binding protein